MKKCIVTIARQYGSGGREVGQKLAELMGCRFYDKDLITLAAQKSGMSTAALDNVDEKAANSLLYTLAMGSSAYTTHSMNQVHMPINDKLFVVQSDIIKELAAGNDSAVIVGRCAEILLEEMNPFSIFVCASRESKLARCKERATEDEKLSDKEILRKMKEVDKQRSSYRAMFTDKDWQDASSYHLSVNTSNKEIKTLVPGIVAYINAWYGEEN